MKIAFEDDPPVDELVRIINAAYDAGEAGIWVPGWRRVIPEWIEEFRDLGELAIARDDDGVVVGCIRVRRLDEQTAEFGVFAVDTTLAGGGIGSALVDFAERAYPVERMRLDLLVPRAAPHPSKQRLHAWYSRLGYREIGRDDFVALYPEAGALLAGGADLVTYEKSLRAAPAT